MTSSLKRRLDKVGPELPTFEEWLGPDGWIKMESEEEKDVRKRGPPYPWREGTEETYLKKVHEQTVAIFAAREGSVPKVSDPEGDPPS